MNFVCFVGNLPPDSILNSHPLTLNWIETRMRFLPLLLVSTLTIHAADLRVGMIGLDTSHTVAFAKLLNDPNAPGHIPGAVITGAFRSGSPDMPVSSMNRVEGYATELATKYGVKLYDSIEELLANCDVVMIENVDGRKHLEIARTVFPTGKPVFTWHYDQAAIDAIQHGTTPALSRQPRDDWSTMS